MNEIILVSNILPICFLSLSRMSKDKNEYFDIYIFKNSLKSKDNLPYSR